MAFWNTILGGVAPQPSSSKELSIKQFKQKFGGDLRTYWSAEAKLNQDDPLGARWHELLRKVRGTIRLRTRLGLNRFLQPGAKCSEV